MSNLESCCYCGQRAGATKDHVPPRNLFPKPRPPDLITVPACEVCHSDAWSKDDEYFRMKVCLSEEAGGHPQAQKVADKALRSLLRPQASGFRRQIKEDTQKKWIRSPSGIMREALTYEVDPDRIDSTIERVTRGLHFHECGERLSVDARIEIFSRVRRYPPDLLKVLQRDIERPLVTLPAKVIGDGVFSYRRFFEKKEDVEQSAWGFTFYGGMPFLVLTRSKVVGVAG